MRDVGTGPSSNPNAATAAPPHAALIGPTAIKLAEALANHDLLYIATNEQRAEAVAAALRCAAPDATVIHCPSSDALPGEAGASSPSNVGRRVAALRAARVAQATEDRPRLAFITTAEAAAGAYPPPTEYDRAPPALAVGDTVDLAALTQTLEEIGYFADDRVDEPGEVAVRGQVVDLYPADALLPIRVDIDTGRIVAIRAYDPVSQLGQETLERIEIGRVVEPVAGASWVTLFAHLPDTAVAIDPGAEAKRDRHAALVRESARTKGKVAVADDAAWKKALAGRSLIDLADIAGSDVPRLVEEKAPLRAFAKLARSVWADGDRLAVLGAARDLRFLAPRLAKASGARCETVAAWGDVRALPSDVIAQLPMAVDRGWRADGIAVLSASDLLGSRALGDREASSAIDPLDAALVDVRIGDVVVHEDFGIGKVAGVTPMVAGGPDDEIGDGIVLEYAGNTRRLVSVDDADRLWRYGADADAVTLDKLDGSSWEKRRIAIDAAIAESARGLTEIAAERDRRTAVVLEPEVAAYERFSAGFAFTETPDQARAIAAVRTDLAAGKPMDRLVVGDVGYGKTEVALRAAAIAVLAGKQVAVAAPTTVLVRQHLELFAKRFGDAGVRVASLSRLSTAAERKETKTGLADGSIAIVIGTGAVAAKGVSYRDLALVVIDEEQRFGASDKAKLRALSREGHALTLTATPIPRTLQAAMIGLQQVSVIATPARPPSADTHQRWDLRTVVGSHCFAA